MPKTLIFVVMILLTLTGWYIGYFQGAKNQIFFDATAKASLYEKALLSEELEREKMLKAFLYRQRCLLSLSDEYKTISIMHPYHQNVYHYYKNNIERICASGNCRCESFAKP